MLLTSLRDSISASFLRFKASAFGFKSSAIQILVNLLSAFNINLKYGLERLQC